MDFTPISATNLWFKVKSGDALSLADLPEIIPLRWSYFRDNWQFIRDGYVQRFSDIPEKDAGMAQVDDLTNFIAFASRDSTSNPFRGSDVLFRFYLIFALTNIADLPLTKQEEGIVQNKTQTIANYTREDFTKLRSSLTSLRDQLSDTIGLEDADYNSIVGRSSAPQQVNATIDSLAVMSTVQSLIKSLDFVLANEFRQRSNTIDRFALARANSNNPEINLASYKAGTLVKMEYGDTMADLAYRYLGDKERWMEISITNGLKPPYIDEIGQEIPLLSNGSGNKLNLPATTISGDTVRDKVYINQVILVSSSTLMQPESRTIKNIIITPVSGEIVLELDGAQDLDRYKVSESAIIRVFKPNTINSNFYIMIPSTDADLDGQKETPWFLSGAGIDEKQAGVDLLLNAFGDLEFGSSGDLQLSYGLQNAVQALKIKLMTERGSNPFHRGLGIPPVQGNTNQDFSSLKASLVESIRTQVDSDPRFGGLTSLSVSQASTPTGTSPRSVVVSMRVRLNGSSTDIPINFSINA